MNTAYADMTLNELGCEILRLWKPINFAAKPYAEAMCQIDSSGMYICDSWDSVVAYFLSNASSWRGDVARNIKKELNRRLKEKE